MSLIYLIRHGQASFGSDHYDRLSETGHRQAKLVARHFRSLGRSFDAVYSGTLRRQRDTAAPLQDNSGGTGSKNLEPVVDERLNEYDSTAVWEHYLPILCRRQPDMAKDIRRISTSRKSFQRLFGAVMNAWVSDPAPGGGLPAWPDFCGQVHRGLERIMQEQGRRRNVAVFTSGGPISVIVQRALDLSDAVTLELSWRIMNASVTRILYSRGGIALQAFNGISHLEVMKDPALLTYR